MSDSELVQIVNCKRQTGECGIPDSPELQKPLSGTNYMYMGRGWSEFLQLMLMQ